MAIRIFIDQGHNPSGMNAGAEGNGLSYGKYSSCIAMQNPLSAYCYPSLRSPNNQTSGCFVFHLDSRHTVSTPVVWGNMSTGRAHARR